MRPDFTDFGRYGSAFQALKDKTCRLQTELMGLENTDQLVAMMDKYCTSSMLWFQVLFAAHGLDSSSKVNERSLIKLWEEFRRIFDPWLDIFPTAQDNYLLPEKHRIGEAGVEVRGMPQIQVDNAASTKISYSSWSNEDIRFLIRLKLRFLEFGAGNGYLVNLLQQKGMTAMGIDPLEPYWVERVGVYPWTRELLTQRRLERGGVEQIARYTNSETALIIGFPEPLSRFPSQALRAFREAGGRICLLKIGDFWGYDGMEESGRLDKYPGDNVFDLISELAKNWKQLPASLHPKFYGCEFENNLFAFEAN